MHISATQNSWVLTFCHIIKFWFLKIYKYFRHSYKLVNPISPPFTQRKRNSPVKSVSFPFTFYKNGVTISLLQGYVD